MNIFEIIDEYLRRSANALLRLREATKHYDLMAAWRNGSLDRMGSVEGIRYEFHGSGVYIEEENFGIEVNFRPGGSIDGFDSWRLWQMIKAEPNLSKVFMSHADVRVALDELLKAGKIALNKESGSFFLEEKSEAEKIRKQGSE